MNWIQFILKRKSGNVEILKLLIIDAAAMNINNHP